MTLQDYLKEKDLSPSAFAVAVGCPASTITRLLNGEREPGLPLIRRIREVTDGAVTANDFLEPVKGQAETPEAAE